MTCGDTKVAFLTKRGRRNDLLSQRNSPKSRARPSWSSTIVVVDANVLRRSTRLRGDFPLGVAAVRELVALGHSERTVYRRCLEGGPWQRVLPGIVMLFTGVPTVDQLVHAALLLAGPDAMVTGIEACRRHGLRRGPARHAENGNGNGNGRHGVHVLVPKRRQVRSVEYVHVERTVRLPDPIVRGGVPLAPLVRSCTDAARRLRSAGEITELLSEPVQRRLCTVSMLSEELRAGSRRGTAIPRAVLADVAEGVRSAAERAAKQFWPSTGLPTPWWNAPVWNVDGEFLGIGDCWIDEVAMLWEIESNEWHLDPDAHEYTVRRAAQFTAAGVVYVASKPKMVLNDRPSVAATLRAAYAQACRRPRPPLRAHRANG
jgi:hypothetical protein